MVNNVDPMVTSVREALCACVFLVFLVRELSIGMQVKAQLHACEIKESVTFNSKPSLLYCSIVVCKMEVYELF